MAATLKEYPVIKGQNALNFLAREKENTIVYNAMVLKGVSTKKK